MKTTTLIIATTITVTSVLSPARAADKVAKPNIVFILGDDLSYVDLGYTGQKWIATPSIDRLAANGLRFTQAYSGAPECAPSRTSLMTGQHMGHCRIRANGAKGGHGYLKLEDVTLAEMLKPAGYATGFVGKWGVDLMKDEGGCRVPVIASWPGHTRPGESRHVMAFYDVMPTLAELAGVAEPKTDGISFAPELLGKPDRQKKHDYLYWENGTRLPHGQAACLGPWYAMREHPSKPLHVFNVEQDAGCTHADIGVFRP